MGRFRSINISLLLSFRKDFRALVHRGAMKTKKFIIYHLTFLALSLCVSVVNLHAQTTEFTYQGRLLHSSLPPTANYDFEFSLWDSLANGTQAGATQTVTGVAVANGIFTVRLNFGEQFSGPPRFLQIAVRPAGGGAYTTLAPRQPITSGPYAIRSLNSTTADTATNSLNLGGVAASQYVVTTDTRMTDARNPLPGSANYIWNQNSVLQPSSNFIISGNGFIGGLLEASAVNISGNGTVGGTLEANVVNIIGNGTAGGTLSGNIVDGSEGFYSGGRHALSLRGSNVLVG